MLLQDKDMVPALLTMKAAMDTILTESFARNDSFAMALKEAFEHFINQRQNKWVLIMSTLDPHAGLLVLAAAGPVTTISTCTGY